LPIDNSNRNSDWRHIGDCAEEQTQRDAIPQLLAMGLTVEQVAQALSLSVEKVRSHLAHH
jgi:DNA-binding NarL/FixJ family response regulator